MADPSAVDLAIVQALLADTGSGGLMTLMTDGVYINFGLPHRNKFVIVSLIAHEDAYMESGSAWERSLYLVKAVNLSPTRRLANAAADRIYQVLQDVKLSIDGYDHMGTLRVERISETEVNPDNDTIIWQHEGGRYEVFVSPTST